LGIGSADLPELGLIQPRTSIPTRWAGRRACTRWHTKEEVYVLENWEKILAFKGFDKNIA